ncbi:MAG TPA: MGMT family protein [Thermomicrobiales bacterium]|nr:MGMT family protein [Thermomicrobiales bacterium]
MTQPDRPTSNEFRDRVYAVVRAIPPGRVTTYGTIARTAGKPEGARQVGWLVHNPPEDVSANCHRIVNSTGYLSGGWSFGHPDVMVQLLQAEGVAFKGELRVDLPAHFWDPTDEQPRPT